MERERENAAAIHNIFQSELWRMRLEAAKVTVDILRTGDSTFSGDLQTPLKLLVSSQAFRTLTFNIMISFLMAGTS